MVQNANLDASVPHPRLQGVGWCHHRGREHHDPEVFKTRLVQDDARDADGRHELPCQIFSLRYYLFSNYLLASPT